MKHETLRNPSRLPSASETLPRPGGQESLSRPRRRSIARAAAIGALVALVPLLSDVAPARAITLEEANLIDEGFRIFTEETFMGNGRTCATCHVPELNYTIGPRDIPLLSEAEKDLVFARNVPGLENETLVRELGLFNIGPGDATGPHLEGPFRGSMAIAGLEVTTFDNFAAGPGAPVFPPEIKTGWFGDGSPSGGFHHGNDDPDADGSIRAFANGAIAQHNPITLDRVAGVDFRFADAQELNALDAFQRWLGRRGLDPSNPNLGNFEFDLGDLIFADSRAEEGKAIFMHPQVSCNTCHTNGGANFDIRLLGLPPQNFDGANIQQDTGVEADRERISVEVGVEIPMDEGSDTNLQSIIEAPRKHAFFHNSAVVGTVEEAATFYFRPPFARANGNPGAPNREALDLVGGHFDTIEQFEAFAGPDGFAKLGAFQRSLSAYYMLRDCQRLLTEAIERIQIGASPIVPADHCRFNLADVRKVLDPRQTVFGLYTNARFSALRLQFMLDFAARFRSIHLLNVIRSDVGELRSEIATVME